MDNWSILTIITLLSLAGLLIGAAFTWVSALFKDDKHESD